MEAAQEKLRVFLLHRPDPGEGDVVWSKVAKALGSFTILETEQTESAFTGTLTGRDLSTYQCVFIDHSLVDWSAFSSYQGPPLLLLNRSPISLLKDGKKDLWGTRLEGKSLLNVGGAGVGDLARLLHLYAIPKRMAGVTPLLEKGSVILGDKIQSTDVIGASLDRMCTYLDQMESFQLKGRSADAHQVLSALLFEAFRRSKESESPYPTIDFQVGINARKLVVNIRFQRGKLNLRDICQNAIDGTDLSWHQAWLYSDAIIVTEHVMHNEVEVMCLFNQPQRESAVVAHSFLQKRLEKSGRRESLLAAPSDYNFQSLSDIRIRHHEIATVAEGEEIADLNALPESVRQKIQELEHERAKLNDRAENAERTARNANEKLVEVARDLSQKRAEITRLTKNNQLQIEKADKRAAELEKRVEQLTKEDNAEAAKDRSTASATGALEQDLKSSGVEKAALNERIATEQKKTALLEQKFAQVHKDVVAKEKEITELKGALLRLRREQEKGGDPNAAAGARAGGGPANDAAKLKDLEAREAQLKQEVKKLLFKTENHEKNVKVIQQEAAEKNKLLEQKLQAAKAKEIELLKKVEELTHMLKKAQKAA